MKKLMLYLIVLVILAGLTSAATFTAANKVVFLPLITTASTEPAPIPGARFSTLLPGSQLPGETECAAAVKPRPENKGVNAPYNATTGSQSLAEDFFTPGSGDERANTQIAARVTGNFTGTTDEILQWAACKWGIDEDLVRAQAAFESWWRQDAKGDLSLLC
jgi:autotransporter family porin